MKLLWIVMGLTASVTWAQNYPLTCRGGEPLRLTFESNTQGIKGEFLRGVFQGGAAGVPGQGQCSWADRAFRAGEPTVFCYRVTAADVRQGKTVEILEALLSPAGSLRMEVANNNAGCMVVASVGEKPNPKVAAAAAPRHVNIKAMTTIKPNFEGAHVMSDDVSPLSLPQFASGPGRLDQDAVILDGVLKGLLDQDYLKVVRDAEARCSNDVYCLLYKRSLAIKIALGIKP